MINCLDLLKALSIMPRKVSSTNCGEYHSACPGCGGTKRFHVHPEKKPGGYFWCRDCSLHGDNIQFCQSFLAMDFPTAARHVGRDELIKAQDHTPPSRLARYHGVAAPQGKKERNMETDRQITAPPEAWQAKAAEFLYTCEQALWFEPKVLAWLAGRGIPAELARACRLGWNAGNGGKDLFRPRIAWDLPLVANEAGKIKKLWLPVGLVIPYLRGGAVHRLRIRRPAPGDGPKYYIVPGSSSGTMCIEGARTLQVVVEAELDALAVVAASPHAGAIATGALALRPDALACQILDSAARVVVCLDTDAESNAGGRRALAWYAERFQRSRRAAVPVGKDPGEAVAAGCDLGAWLATHLPLPPTQAAGEGGHKSDRYIEGVEGVVSPAVEVIANPVRELAELCLAYRVRLRHLAGGVELLMPPGLSAATVWRLSNLVFGNEDIGRRIDQLPDGLLGAKELLG